MEESKAVVYLDTLLDLIVLANRAELRGEMIVDDSRDMKSAIWHMKQAKDSLSKAAKYLNKEL